MLAGTIVTILGLLPVGFAQSAPGEYVRNMFWVVCIALLTSWIVAVTFTPYMGVKLLPDIKPLEYGDEDIYETPNYKRFRGLIRWSVRHKFVVAGSVVVLFLVSIAGLAAVQKQFFPNSVRTELLAVAQPIPVPTRTVPIGLPSDLLRRRPDIRQAERQVAAATARVGVAVADYYPRVSLTGSFVLDASHFARTGDWDSRQFGLGPAVSWNLFDAGRIRNNFNCSESRQRETFVQYQQVVVKSLKEVETAISRYKKGLARRASLQEVVNANERSVSLAKEQ